MCWRVSCWSCCRRRITGLSLPPCSSRLFRPLQYAEGIAAPRAQAYSSGAAPQASPLGWAAVGAAVLVGALLAWGRNLRWPWGGRRASGGRWVRDRSLGGRMVFIPDPEPLEGGAARPARPLYEDPDAGAVPEAAPAGGALGPWSDAGPAAPAAAPRAFELPAWWEAPSRLVYSTPARKEELQRRARATLRYLQDQKLEVGGVGRGGVGWGGRGAGVTGGGAGMPGWCRRARRREGRVLASCGWHPRVAETAATTLPREARHLHAHLRTRPPAPLQGQDYPVSGLVELRTLCQEAGGYQVRIRAPRCLRAAACGQLSWAPSVQCGAAGGLSLLVVEA